MLRGSARLPRPLRYWTLLGQKAGDNRQVEALGAAATTRFGWEGTAKRLAFNGLDLWLQLSRQASLAAVQAPFRSQLTPPWPDLVLTAGRRNEPVARWLRRASGGRCKSCIWDDPGPTQGRSTSRSPRPNTSWIRHSALQSACLRPWAGLPVQQRPLPLGTMDCSFWADPPGPRPYPPPSP